MNTIILLLAMQLQHHTLQPESCEDRIARQRHWLVEAAQFTEDAHEREMMLTWYVDSFRTAQVRRVCADPKLTAVVMIRFTIAEVIVSFSRVPKGSAK